MIIKKTDLLINLYFLLYSISVVVAYFNKALIYGTIILFPFIFFSYYFLNHSRSMNKVILLIVFMGLLIFMNGLFQQSEIKLVIFNLIINSINLFIAYTISQRKVSKRAVLMYVTSLFTIFFFVLLIRGTDPNLFFPDSSRNTFSWLALTATCLLYIVYLQQIVRFEYKSLPIWPALSSVAISILAIGRSGIISNVFLLVGVLWNKNSYNRRKLLLFVNLGVCIALSGCLLLAYHPNTVELVMNKFRLRVSDDARVEITENYFIKLNTIGRVVFSYNLKQDPFFEKWNANPHNSLLKLHNTIGLLGLFILACIVNGVHKKGKTNRMIYFIAVAMFFRVLTDSVAFTGYFDFVFFYFLFKDKEDLNKK